jgi:hypothetical protein
MERAVRVVVIAVLAVATAAMYAVSMRANFLYGYGIGQSPDTKLAIAWANVAADLWKGFGLVVAVDLWRAMSRRAAILISLTWFVCFVFSVSSAIGIYVQERSALTGSREAQHASLAEAALELHQIDQKLKREGERKTVAEVEADIAAIFARPIILAERVRGTVGTISNNCTKHDARTANACADVARLHADLAHVAEATRLEERAAELRRTIDSLRTRGGASAPDPVGEFWAWLTRGFFSVKDVGFGLPLAFAVMIEMVSAFGPLGIVAYAEATRGTRARDVSRHVAKHLAVTGLSATISDTPAVPDGVAAVVSYIAERTEPTENAAGIGVQELFADYLTWCKQGNVAALRLREFTGAFDGLRAAPELEGKIKKFGARYFGIALATTRGVAGGRA